MHSEIDIRAFLLGPDHLRRAPVSLWLREWRTDGMAQEVSEIHLNLRPVAPQRAEIYVLSLGLRRVSGRTRNPCREVLDREYLVVRLEHLLEQRDQIQPFPWRSLEDSVVEIEPVYIDERAH